MCDDPTQKLFVTPFALMHVIISHGQTTFFLLDVMQGEKRVNNSTHLDTTQPIGYSVNQRNTMHIQIVATCVCQLQACGYKPIIVQSYIID